MTRYGSVLRGAWLCTALGVALSACGAPETALFTADGQCAAVSQTPDRAQRERITAALAELSTARVPESDLAFLPGPENVADFRAPHVERFWSLGGLAAFMAVAEEGDATKRLSLVWDEREAPARLIHVHLSAPVALGSQLPDIAPVSASDGDVELVRRVESFWRSWSDKRVDDVAAHYVEDDSTAVILPWVADVFPDRSGFFAAAQNVLEATERFGMAPMGEPRIWSSPEAALSAGVWTADVLGADGTVTRGDARYTLLWRRCEDGWRVQHEHLSSWDERG